MELKWSYVLLGVLYVIVAVTKMIIYKLEEDIKKEYTVEAFPIFRKDFLYLVALGCLVTAIIISIVTVVFGTPYNIHGPILTLLLVALAIANSTSHIMVLESGSVIVCGEEIERGRIEKIKTTEVYFGFSKHVMYVTPKKKDTDKPKKDADPDSTPLYEFYSHQPIVSEMMKKYSRKKEQL
ncbi:MAG: hypothetical protein ATN34_04755 [Epulopiscium sp. Nele67-Bin002]|nr:MAG: hypothetical protein BEN18_06000 [Epulopiscium sp. Nuni2H_MBin001]OON92092.1 MAG: hypothetical protein ATN34_04755 [Epulopiscium sp. Nele67-Bin002]OON93487.1 MAG: hypothetical protein ATN33_05665 [Epulopiscium sp. Nele67-Bin001]